MPAFLLFLISIACSIFYINTIPAVLTGHEFLHVHCFSIEIYPPWKHFVQASECDQEKHSEIQPNTQNTDQG